MTEFAKKILKVALAFLKPRILLWLLLVASFVFSAALFFGRINTYIIYYSGQTATVRTLSNEIGDALCCAGIDADSYIVDTAEAKQGNETVVSLLKTFTVPITAGNSTVTVKVLENNTVEQVLNCAGFSVDQYDMVEPAPSTVVSEGTYIDYINIDYVTGSYTRAIPHSMTTIYSGSVDVGKNYSTPGRDGLEQVNYTKKLVNGEEVETSVTGKVTLLAAQNSVLTVGTRTPEVKASTSIAAISQLTPDIPIALDANGDPINYKKHITVQATAYTYTGFNCSTGVAPKPGYIAVNPKIIPYGTKMYIRSSDGRYVYGYAIAADTGGFIFERPTNVDLFFPTVVSMNDFGRRNVEIYILE
ncbi:MAG: G5 domain-containing protein [Clostridia bacterium]|nr:G5 domain-containing protein [Clostridia bacterium]